MSSINRMSQQPWSPTASNGWCEDGDPDGWDLDVFNGCSFFSDGFILKSNCFWLPQAFKNSWRKWLVLSLKKPILKTIAPTATTTNPRYLNSKCFIIWLENSCCCSIEPNSSVGNRALWTNVTQKGTEKEKNWHHNWFFVHMFTFKQKKSWKVPPPKKKTSQAFRGWG